VAKETRILKVVTKKAKKVINKQSRRAFQFCASNINRSIKRKETIQNNSSDKEHHMNV
jgi:hypothetical protein